MSQSLRIEVLKSFKALHRTRQKVFNGDIKALTAGRAKINEEYKKHKQVQDKTAISELVQHANAVEEEIRTCVIQAREVAPGTYEVKISRDTVRMDNVPYNDCKVKN